MDLFGSSMTLPDVGLAKSVRESWERELLVDYTIQVGDEQFKVHKVVMASVSDYFKAMLTGGMMESREDTARLEGFSSLAVQNIIEYIYTNEISGPQASAKEFLACAVYLQVPEAIGAGTKLLWNKLNSENCWDIAATFKMYSLNEAVERTKKYIKSNLDEIQKIPEAEVEGLAFEAFEIFCELWEHSEWDLFVVIKDWVNMYYDNRLKHLRSLMSLVQFNVMTPTEVESVRSMDVYSDESWRDLVEAAEEYRNLPTHQKMMQAFRVRGDPLPVCFYMNGHQQFCALKKDGNWDKEVDSSTIPQFPDGTLTSVVFNNFLLVCESYSSNQAWHVFDARTLEWSTMAKMVTPKTDFALVHDGNGSVYALGGRVDVGSVTESVTDCIEKYDVKTNTWSVLETTLPLPLYQHCACLCFGLIYVAGGWQTTDKLQPWSLRMDCYDPATTSWQTKVPLGYSLPCHVMHLLEFDGEQVIVMMDEELRLHLYYPKINLWTEYGTGDFDEFQYYRHSTFLASPTENALYLLNFRPVDGDDSPGGCIKLKTDGWEVEVKALHPFPLWITSKWGDGVEKNAYISVVLAIPPASQKDQGAITHGI